VHMALQADGSIVATIQVAANGLAAHSQIVEIDSTGQFVSQLVDEFAGTYNSLAIGAAGRVVVDATASVGLKQTTLQVFAGGAPDLTFNGSGVLTLGAGDRATAEPNGTFLILNNSGTSPLGPVTLHHVLANGTVDATFGRGGVLAPAFSDQPFFVTGNPVALADGSVVVPGSDSPARQDGSVAVAKVQVAAGSATNPTVTGVTLVAPTVGQKYAYATLTFAQGAANLDPTDVGANISVIVSKNGVGGSTKTTLTASLASTSGGNGDPLTATYVFRISPAFSSSDSGLYQFVAPAGLQNDLSGAGSVGSIAGSYTVYIPRGRNRVPVVLATTTPLDTI
jgi:hypothetical protein